MLKRDNVPNVDLRQLNKIYLEMVKDGKTQVEEAGLKVNIVEVEAPWIFKAMWNSTPK